MDKITSLFRYVRKGTTTKSSKRVTLLTLGLQPGRTVFCQCDIVLQASFKILDKQDSSIKADSQAGLPTFLIKLSD